MGSEKLPKGSPKGKNARLYLIDGHSLCYRAYYAIRQLSNSKGEPTNAIYGFLTMLLKLMREETPDYMGVCFDRPEQTFRHKKFDAYKAHRKPMPEDLVEQMEPIKSLCKAYRLVVFEKPGFEADDVIGTLACQGAHEGLDVFIVTADKDAMQLVNDQIRILNPHGPEIKVIDREAVKFKFDGLGPEQVTDVMALVGDASDNIPGVQGIGEKTAVKLIKQFGSVEGLIRNAAKINSKSQKQMILDHLEDMKLSKELATIDTTVPLQIEWKEMKVGEPDQETLIALLKRYEFKSLLKEFTPTASECLETREYKAVSDEKAFDKLIQELEKIPAFSFDTETTSPDPMKARLVGISVSFSPLTAFYIPIASSFHQGPGINQDKVLKKLKPILEDPKQKKYGQNIKYDWIVMKRAGIDIQGYTFDTMIASYLSNPLKLNHNLDDITFEYLGIQKTPTESLIGSGKQEISMAKVPLENIKDYASEDADCVWRLVPLFAEKLKHDGLEQLFEDLEMPLAKVLAKIEMNGVNIDVKFLKELSDNAGEELDRLTREIFEEVGEEFNLNSPKQLADVLFVRMKLPVIRRTKTGYSTDVSVLEKLSETHEFPKKILEYREKMKLKTTYLDALPLMVNPETNLIHTSYHQTTTATGRLSSSDPNLQNIPIKTEYGRMIRKAFIPRNAGKRSILSADYSQIELRILAHLSGDPNLVSAFKEDRDIHKFTATLLYGTSEADVTREMRNLAKVINFSIIYGKTSFGLSGDLGISISEAEGFIQNYFERYSTVKEYLEAQKEMARKQGYLTTILGRRAYFPDINSKNGQMRQFAERAAVNAPIQGSSADLIKLAMIAIQKKLEELQMDSLMIMQVHDELVFDALDKELPQLESLVKTEMEKAYKLRIPLRVDIDTGGSWYKN